VANVRAGVSGNDSEMLDRARSLISVWGQSANLCLAVAGGPAQQIIRPSKLSAPDLRDALKQKLLFGDLSIFTDKQGIKKDAIEGNALVIGQDEASLLLDERGTVRVIQPIAHKGSSRTAELSVILKEDVYDRIMRGIQLIDWVLERVDPEHRLRDVVIVGAISKFGVFGWRTRAEHQASPHSITYAWPMNAPDPIVVQLAPQPRETLAKRTIEVTEDLTELLDRQAH
jgi:hypothetical protein